MVVRTLPLSLYFVRYFVPYFGTVGSGCKDKLPKHVSAVTGYIINGSSMGTFCWGKRQSLSMAPSKRLSLQSVLFVTVSAERRLP